MSLQGSTSPASTLLLSPASPSTQGGTMASTLRSSRRQRTTRRQARSSRSCSQTRGPRGSREHSSSSKRGHTRCRDPRRDCGRGSSHHGQGYHRSSSRYRRSPCRRLQRSRSCSRDRSVRRSRSHSRVRRSCRDHRSRSHRHNHIYDCRDRSSSSQHGTHSRRSSSRHRTLTWRSSSDHRSHSYGSTDRHQGRKPTPKNLEDLPQDVTAEAAAEVDHTRRTVVHVAGFAFTAYHESAIKLSYRCSSYRRTKCKAKLHFSIKDNEYAMRGEHSCESDRTALAPGLDVTEQMKEATDVVAITRMDLTAERIWKRIRSDFYPDGLTIVQFGLTREQVIRRVHRTRRNHFGVDLHGIVEVPPLSLVPGTTQPFFQFYRSYMNGTTLERLVGWAHPALIKLLKYKKTTVFIDGTFRCVPRPFYQCVVIMVFDAATDLFVPVFYSLCSAKTQDTYWHLLEAVCVAADDKIDPSMIVCDFEAGLQEAVQVQFHDAAVVGCYFHFKQACRRKMKSLGIPEAEIRIAMTKGNLDMLTVIPHEKINGRGIRYVQDKIQLACTDAAISFSEAMWSSFWVYFRNTWLKKYKPSVWNVSEIGDDGLVSRTNNPLERFNREINAAVAAPHPSLPSFVGMIQSLSSRSVDRIEDMAQYRSKKLPRRIPEPTDLPVPVEL